MLVLIFWPEVKEFLLFHWLYWVENVMFNVNIAMIGTECKARMFTISLTDNESADDRLATYRTRVKTNLKNVLHCVIVSLDIR